MSSPAVLLVGSFLSWRGGSRCVCEDLAERLRGMQWRVLTASARARRMERAIDMVSTAWIRRREYDVAHVDVYSGTAFLWAEAVCWTLRRVRRPYVLTLHGGNLPVFARKHPRRISALLKSAAAVTCPSRYLSERIPGCRADIIHLPNGVDLNRIAFRPRHILQPRLVWVRAFHRIYDPAMAVEVLARVRQEYPAATLHMIGPDKGDGALKEALGKVAELGLAGSVRITPGVPRNDIPRLLAAEDIFLNTARIDNTPVSVLEAMAAGLCVVSTGVGGVPYLLEHERDAVLTPAGDRDAMANAVVRLLRDSELAAGLSRRGRAQAEQFDWNQIEPRWAELFRRTASAGARA